MQNPLSSVSPACSCSACWGSLTRGFPEMSPCPQRDSYLDLVFKLLQEDRDVSNRDRDVSNRDPQIC
ncbi:hypothetical protein CesoFtcFv8_025096 [Champsocephalus esox]|uniref:Uncharacterized protein n=1 Tax=Champsocephalus esox TaxID=159716 RepID=A0AAN8B3P1_9TELE|nr:hypothetical protein CesoFtcFv8_025096 [Champsocephalus esox]